MDTFHSSQTDSLVGAEKTDAALSRSIKEIRAINQNGLIQLDLPKADKEIGPMWTNTLTCTQGQIQHVGMRVRIRTPSHKHLDTDIQTKIK